MNQDNITLDVPADIAVDIAALIVKHSLRHSIIGADEKKGTVRMEILFPPIKKPVQANIEELIDTYNWFRYEEHGA